RMSLYKWGGYTAEKTFVGLKNFVTLFQSDRFYQAFQNSILLIVLVTIVTFALAIIFAAVLTREKLKGQTFFRVVFYIPNILSVVVISAIFSAIYDPTQGLLNSFLNLFRNADEPILWLGSQKLVIYSIVIAMVWQAIGYYMVMYMASMANIPESLYESAKLEGAGRLTQFFSITLPLIWTNIRTTLTFFVISTINMSFLFVKAMTNGGPDGASSVFLSYMYQEAYTNSSYGYGMAIGVTVFLFSFALAAVLNAATKRDEIEF
ncbi:MAG: carbohydrate ABC transporter permease, partial [Lachnospiraceae bacterium]